MSIQNRVDPFEIRPESGLARRWPMRWRPGTSVERGTRFWPSGFRVYTPVWPLLYNYDYFTVPSRPVFIFFPAKYVKAVPTVPSRLEYYQQ